PKTTKRKAAPKRNSTRAGRVKKTTAVKTMPREARVLPSQCATEGKKSRNCLLIEPHVNRREAGKYIAGIVIASRTAVATNFPRDCNTAIQLAGARAGSELTDAMSATTIRSNESSFIAVGKESGSILLSRDDVEMSLTTPSSDSAK
ncbi:11219_t:CDS:1, partial [Paraglomus occultum]